MRSGQAAVVTAPHLCGIQRCIRLDGKHNDRSNIGLSKRHLSFFFRKLWREVRSRDDLGPRFEVGFQTF
ncbi:MAG: alanine--tRNA ligase-related protein [Candidatus Hodgkinia cicadicola]